MMTVLLTHDAFQIAATGEVEAQAYGRTADPVSEALVQGDTDPLAKFLPQ
jgi:hypothetical protein